MVGTILVVDDEKNIVKLVKSYLEREGYRVVTAFDGERAIQSLETEKPDLIILDRMLPEVSGEDVCEYVRQYSSIPIIMLTAKVSEDERVVGLRMGADDYVIKPFSPKELVARVQAVLRRVRSSETARLQSGDGCVVLDTEFRKAWLCEREMSLTPTEFSLLGTLLSRIGKAFSREELAHAVFGWDADGSEESIYVHMKNLRKKLGEKGDRPYIRTVYGVGYRWDE